MKGWMVVVGVVVLAAVGTIGGVVGAATAGGGSSTVVRRTVVERGSAVAASSPSGLSAQQIYQRDAPGVVVVTATTYQSSVNPLDPFGPPQRQAAGVLGSGFVISKSGYILTNAHVVLGGHNVRVGFSSGKTYPAKVVGADSSTDVAVLRVKLPASSLHPLPLADSRTVRPGNPVVAIGNPLGEDRTITEGIVSAISRQIQSLVPGKLIYGAIQTDAAINHGNSGGPLINAAGQVVGITSQILSSGQNGGNIGIGFAIPINTARQVATQIERTGTARHAYLGVEGTDLSPQIADALNLTVKQGVLVERVQNGSPAAKAGLHGGTTQATIDGQTLVLGGDVITQIDGRPVTDFATLAETINNLHPGDRVSLTLVRGGHTRRVTVTLGTLK
jgi:S1-C subfamily serine protease